MSRVLEVCVDSYVSALAAINGGANRLELCSALTDGGLTPTPGLLKQIHAANDKRVQIFCMLRCRNFNFVYTQEELNIMTEDALILKQNGANGFVFGALLENGDVDLKKCREIIKVCYPLPVTFHRAFDICRNPLIQLESIIDLGFSRVLTSGQKKSAEEGIELIKQLKKRGGDRIIVMPGAGVSKDNIKLLIDETDAIEYHGSFQLQQSNKDNQNKNEPNEEHKNENESNEIKSNEVLKNENNPIGKSENENVTNEVSKNENDSSVKSKNENKSNGEPKNENKLNEKPKIENKSTELINFGSITVTDCNLVAQTVHILKTI